MDRRWNMHRMADLLRNNRKYLYNPRAFRVKPAKDKQVYTIEVVAKGWQIQRPDKTAVNNITFEKQSEAIAYLDRLIAMFYNPKENK